MRRILVIVFCLSAALAGRHALAADASVYAPLVGNPDYKTWVPPSAAAAQPATASLPAPAAVSMPVAPGAAPSVEPSDPRPAPVPSQPQKMTALEAVERGKNLLAPVLVDFKNKEAKIKPLASKAAATAAALAIWDKNADTVTVYGGTRGAKFFTADNNGPVVPIVAAAGSQTAYRDKDANTVVVGTVQASMAQVAIKKKKAYKPSFSYYVPYSSDLYSTDTLAAGSDYLSGLIQDAFNELDAKQITSRAFPGKSLTSVIDPYLIKSIAVIEHADSQIFAADASEEALGRFLVKLALNKDGALNSALSTAGARGMVQFIPSTYKLMVIKRPDLALVPDFAKGMADHNNAIKAEAAYLDMILADLPQAIRDKYVLDKGSAAGYIAAGYNGGSARVKKAIRVWGDAWSVSHAADYANLTARAASLKTRLAQIDKKLRSAKITASEVRSLKSERAKAIVDRAAALSNAANIKNTWLVAETAGYVVKLRRVYTMLAAGFFATPNTPESPAPAVAAASPPASLALTSISSAPAAANP